MNKKSRFALFLGNRGMFPAELQQAARAELMGALEILGHEVIAMPYDSTRAGAVETMEEGRKYARFLKENEDNYDGVILALPNFGDENGAMAAFQDCGKPIFIQAYPDELDKMSPELRRDSFCGKMSIMDVFVQCGIDFTIQKPHTVSPASPAFNENIDYFDRLCRVVKTLRSVRVGAVGARTTAFKTVRFDEVALQRHGITSETYDLSEVFARARALAPGNAKMKDKMQVLDGYAKWPGIPEESRLNLARLGVVLDDMMEEYRLDCLALRCWMELEAEMKISPCVILSEMNNRGIAAACELDVANAVMMHGLAAASGSPVACLDWNNNYADDEDKCILFHCGPVPQEMMADKGCVVEHAILMNSIGPGCTYGCNAGRIKPMPMTYGSLLTRDGILTAFLGDGRFTADPIPENFFGCAGVAEIPGMQDMLMQIGYAGFRHHVSVATGQFTEPVAEALTKYLGWDVMVF